MPYEIEVKPEARLAILRGYGDTNVDESHANLLELSAHPEFQPGFGLLCDLREMTHRPDTRDIMESAENTMRFRALLTGRVAVVTNEALALPAELGAAITAREGIEQRVFSDYEEARA
ncbi:MAG: hypothetical protein HKP30_03695, partial [Myxococcales bacterium]|nr:hypothetical protein [Myxococcales bacterium]